MNSDDAADGTGTGSGPRQPVLIAYRPKDEPLAAFPAERTALVVIDPINDILSEGGAVWT